jgi:predicted DNA-binding transcriptional regulator YafY
VTYKDGDQFIRPFRIDRIRNVEVLEEKRIPPERLPIGDMTAELKAYRKNNTDSFTGQSTSVEVVWEDEPSVLYDVFGLSNVEFVRDVEGADGRVFVIKAQKNQGLYHNLLRLGSRLTVLGPAAVKDEYVGMVREIIGKY